MGDALGGRPRDDTLYRDDVADYEAMAKSDERQAKTFREKGRKAATAVTKQSVNAYVKEKKGIKVIKDAAIKAFPRHERQLPPGISDYLLNVKRDIFKLFNTDAKDPIATKLNTILEYKEDIEESDLTDTVKTLQSLIRRVEGYVKRFTPETDPLIKEAKRADRALTNGKK